MLRKTAVYVVGFVLLYLLSHFTPIFPVITHNDRWLGRLLGLNALVLPLIIIATLFTTLNKHTYGV